MLKQVYRATSASPVHFCRAVAQSVFAEVTANKKAECSQPSRSLHELTLGLMLGLVLLAGGTAQANVDTWAGYGDWYRPVFADANIIESYKTSDGNQFIHGVRNHGPGTVEWLPVNKDGWAMGIYVEHSRDANWITLKAPQTPFIRLPIYSGTSQTSGVAAGPWTNYLHFDSSRGSIDPAPLSAPSDVQSALSCPAGTTAVGSGCRFDFTGSPQTFTIPPGVTQLSVDAYGASSSVSSGMYAGYCGGYQAKGGRVQATLEVSSGQVLTIYVGGMSVYCYASGVDCLPGGQQNSSGQPGGWNGGGNGAKTSEAGGGATDVMPVVSTACQAVNRTPLVNQGVGMVAAMALRPVKQEVEPPI